MSFKKQYLKSRPICKVTFRISKEAVDGASTVHIVGEFNDWDKNATPMKRLKTGDFVATVDMDVGREYQYRFLLNNTTWINDAQADKYVPSHYRDVDNSVIII